MEDMLKIQNQPKKCSPASSRAIAKGKILSDKLKPQLQKKSRAHRERHAAETKVESAASYHGRNDLQPDLQLVERPIDNAMGFVHWHP